MRISTFASMGSQSPDPERCDENDTSDRTISGCSTLVEALDVLSRSVCGQRPLPSQYIAVQSKGEHQRISDCARGRAHDSASTPHRSLHPSAFDCPCRAWRASLPQCAYREARAWEERKASHQLDRPALQRHLRCTTKDAEDDTHAIIVAPVDLANMSFERSINRSHVRTDRHDARQRKV